MSARCFVVEELGETMDLMRRATLRPGHFEVDTASGQPDGNVLQERTLSEDNVKT